MSEKQEDSQKKVEVGILEIIEKYKVIILIVLFIIFIVTFSLIFSYTSDYDKRATATSVFFLISYLISTSLIYFKL